ncbi:MAG TPA: 30S ribosomal protein S7 [Actinomycetota bacterium]|nr:30S ribosomal protein S7 [Actinomycetota bacterium]
MPRRGAIPKREIRPDPLHDSQLVTQLINKVMQDGKKTLAERIVYEALDDLNQRSGMEHVPALKKAVDNVKPLLEVRSRRVGGTTYQVPVDVPARRGTSLAIRWLVGTARGRKGKGMAEKLSAELLDALQGTGTAVKKREDLHKMADANRAFAHFRW